jgi:hypothetical protein
LLANGRHDARDWSFGVTVISLNFRSESDQVAVRRHLGVV